jgi:hypothetical protein
MRSVIAKSAFTGLAAAAAIALAFTSEGLALQYGLWTSPGMYVWTRLHPDPGSASLGSFFATMLAIDSSCWFIVLCAAGWWLSGRPIRLKGSPKVEQKRHIPVAFWVFCACLVAFLGFIVFRAIQSRHKSEEMVAAQQRAIAEAPPMVDAPTFKFLPPEQALIVREIAGLYPWLPDSRIVAQGSPVMPTVEYYSVGYTTTKDPGPDSVRRVVAVGVTEFPNAEWARYRVNHNQVYAGLGSAQSLKKVKKFGRTVVQDAANRHRDGGGRLCFIWPDETFVVSVCYETPEVNEEFIREYLEKYPSSL